MIDITRQLILLAGVGGIAIGVAGTRLLTPKTFCPVCLSCPTLAATVQAKAAAPCKASVTKTTEKGVTVEKVSVESSPEASSAGTVLAAQGTASPAPTGELLSTGSRPDYFAGAGIPCNLAGCSISSASGFVGRRIGETNAWAVLGLSIRPAITVSLGVRIDF